MRLARLGIGERDSADVIVIVTQQTGHGRVIEQGRALIQRGANQRDAHARIVELPIVILGAAIELIHSATLLHDDILDRGLVRRGKPSPLARYGTEQTLVTGDFLFSRAFGVAGRFDSLVVGWATDACT